jgi:hypothetical protein
MANRYWVGGTGLWDASTTHWSATSGGSAGASAPTSTDNVFFDQAGTYQVSINAAVNCLDLTISAGTVTVTSTGNLAVFGNFSILASTIWSHSANLTYSATTAKTITTNGVSLAATIFFDGVGGSWQLLDAFTTTSVSGVTLTNGTLNLNGKSLVATKFASNNANTRTLAFGAGSITCNGAGGTMWDTGTVTGMTVTGTPVVNISNNSATATTISPGSLSEAYSISFNFTTGTYATTLSAGSYNNLSFVGFSGSWVSVAATTVYGNYTQSSTVGGPSATFSMTFASTSATARIITCNGFSLGRPVIFNGVGGTWQLADALTMGSTRNFTQTNGTVDLNGKTLTVGTAYTTATGTKNLTFNGGTLVCPTASTTAFNNAQPTNYTTTAGTGTGKISMTAATAKTFVGGGSTFNCTLSNDGAGALTITGANTFATIANGVQPTSFLFTAATTTTVTNWSVSGTSGNLVTIGSVTTATHTLSKASGTVSSNYLSISFSIATGGAAWYAGNNSTNGGNNTGWLFSAPPIAYSITATNGTYTLNGQSVGIKRGIVLSGSYGSYAVTGRSITIAKGSLLLPQNGLYFLTGQAVDITYTPTPPVTGPTQYFIEIRSFTETRRI